MPRLLLPPEFLAAALNRSLLEKQDLLVSAFRHFDIDGDGFISREDLQQVWTHRGVWE